MLRRQPDNEDLKRKLSNLLGENIVDDDILIEPADTSKPESREDPAETVDADVSEEQDIKEDPVAEPTQEQPDKPADR
ncbi:MAG: hypothetical protein GY869_23065 [Planctomycetes bacterium]|nr:hypothetical protein [Planctomycetota bacterium]